MTQPEALRRYKLTRRWRQSSRDSFRTGWPDGQRTGGGIAYLTLAGTWCGVAAWRERTSTYEYASLPAALRAVERWLERAKEKK